MERLKGCVSKCIKGLLLAIASLIASAVHDAFAHFPPSSPCPLSLSALHFVRQSNEPAQS